MSFVDAQNQYHRTTIVIDRFDVGPDELVKNETVSVQPPCVVGVGCRASSYEQEHCEFNPRTGLCDGRMA